MKKATKLILLFLIGTGVMGAYYYKEKISKQEYIKNALDIAKLAVSKNGQEVIGSWVNLTSEWSQVLQKEIYIGGVNTPKKDYTFIVDAITGDIISLT